MSGSFDYQSAPIGSRRVLTVAEFEASLQDGSGKEKSAVHYRDVTTIRFVANELRRHSVYRLDLVTDDGVFRVPLNGARGMSASEPPLSSFFLGCSSLLSAISKQRADLEVELGESRPIRLVWFVLGVICLLTGLGLPILAFVTGVRAEKIFAALLPMAFLVVLGIPVVRAFRPGKAPPTIPIESLIQTLVRLREGR